MTPEILRATTVRLSKATDQGIAAIIAAGMAGDQSEAIRVAVALTAKWLREKRGAVTA